MDTNIPRRRRATAFRRAGWLGVALLVTLSLVGPGAAGVAARGAAPGGGSDASLVVQAPQAPEAPQAPPTPPTADLTTGTTNPGLPTNVCKEADFGFVVDRSGSINSTESAAEKSGVNSFVSAFELAGGFGAYEGTTFSGSSATATPFTPGFVGASAFTPLVTALPGTGGNTPTGAGIDAGAANTSGDRPTAPNVLFVVTDGSPNVPTGSDSNLNHAAAWLNAANVAIIAANNARHAGWVVDAIYVGAPDSSMPFGSAGNATWVDAVMKGIGGGSYTSVGSFSDLAAGLLIASGCTAPNLVVTKTVDKSTAQPGETLTYTVTLQNTGTGDATGVTVTDDLSGLVPAYAALGSADGGSLSPGNVLTWIGQAIAAGTTNTYTYSVTLASTFPLGTTSLTNKVVVANSNCAADSQDRTGCSTDTTVAMAPNLVVTKTASSTSDETGATAQPGDALTYTLSVQNKGNVDATGVTVTDDINSLVPAYASYSGPATPPTTSSSAGILTWTNQTFDAGAPATTYTYSVTLNSSGWPAGATTTYLNNTVVVPDSNCGVAPTSPASAASTCSTTTTVATAPNLVVSKAVDKLTANPGDTVTYTLTVRNNGNADATGVAVTDDITNLLVHATYNDDANLAGSYSAPVLTWSDQTLVAGAAGTKYTFSVKLAASGWTTGTTDLANTVVVAGSNCGAVSTDILTDSSCSKTTTVTTGTDLRITKGVSPASIKGGTSTGVTYTIVVKNQGNGLTAGHVLVTDADLPFFFAASSLSCVPNPNPATCDLVHLTGAGIDIGVLDGGASASVTVAGTAYPNNSTDLGGHVNTASAQWGDGSSIFAHATLTVSSTPPPTCQQLGTCPTPTPTSTPTPTPTPTSTPTGSVEAATSSPAPTSAVQGTTSKPHVTPPPTSALGGTTGQPAGDTWRLILLALAGLLASLLLLTPTSPARARRRR